jgi:hypothetical protein
MDDTITLKMYVWTDVLCDYTSGMICVLAYSLDHAREEARKILTPHYHYEVDTLPDVYSSPQAVCVYGGG